ncbi:hypothetical protein BG004_003573 [Podila humilis]|nr:hypothetical protein BG004_003573 [Podila humilis]
MSFNELDRSLSTPPRSPSPKNSDRVGSKHGPISIIRPKGSSPSGSLANNHGMSSPISPPPALPSPNSFPNGFGVARGSSRDSIGLDHHLHLQQQEQELQGHGPIIVQSLNSHPPPVSPKRKPQTVHSRILQDNTRIDTPRPTITSTSSTAAPYISALAASSALPSSNPQTNPRVLGNLRRGGDHERRQILSPPTSPPQFSPTSSRTQVMRGPQEMMTGSANGINSNNSNTRVTIERSSVVHHPFGLSIPATLPQQQQQQQQQDQQPVSQLDQEHDYDMTIRHLSQQIFNISSNVAVLERLVPYLGQRHKDTKEMRANLHTVLDTTQELVKSAHSQVKGLARYHLPNSSSSGTTTSSFTPGLRVISTPSATLQQGSVEAKVLASRRLTHQRLTKDLGLASRAFQELQRQVVEAERRQVATLRRLSTNASIQRQSKNRRSDLMDLSQSDIEDGALIVDLGHVESHSGNGTSSSGGGSVPFSITVVPRDGGSSSINSGYGSMGHHSRGGGGRRGTGSGVLGTSSSPETMHASSHGILVHDRELSVQEEALLQELLVMDGELATQESILQERESEILKIEQGMGQVLEVMRELGTLVHEQQGGVDFLHDNILQTRGRIQLAQKELVQASEHQRKSREKLCYMVLIASIVGAIIAFVLM